jgi:galactokinase
MDQTIVAGARPGHAMLLDCRDKNKHFVPVDAKELRVVIANTMIDHELSEGEYEQRVESCKRGVEYFRTIDSRIRSLRDVSIEMMQKAEGKLDPLTFRRCRHVVTEIDRTSQAGALLAKRRYEDVGELMLQSHASLKTDYEVSCQELDFLVEQAMKTRGVYGARMTGAGFGGCIVALVQPRLVETLIGDLKSSYKARFNIHPTVFATAAAGGAAVVE